MIVIADALSIVGVSYLLGGELNAVGKFFACFVVITSGLSHFLIPRLTYNVASYIRDNTLSFAYGLKENNYRSLEGVIQKDEMIYLNLIVSDVFIATKLVTLAAITIALLISTDLNKLLIFIVVPFSIICYRMVTQGKQRKITTNIASKFHELTEIRKIGSTLAKSAFYNKAFKFVNYISSLHDDYYRSLAQQSSLSNGYRSAIEVSGYFSLILIAALGNGTDVIKPLIIIGYSAMKVLPIVQQINFYASVRTNGKNQLDSLKISPPFEYIANQNELHFLFGSESNVKMLVGRSGSGKSTLLDAFATALDAKGVSFAYYVQNQYPFQIYGSKFGEADWAPTVHSYEEILLGKYSVGEVQRMALSATLAKKVSYILLDEPFSSQSPDYVLRIAKTMNDVICSGTKFVIISHVDIDSHFTNIDKFECIYDRHNPRPS